MDAFFVCLANSLKRGGRCVAGVEVKIDNAGNWTVVQNADGCPKWIRPINSMSEYGEINIGEARYIPLLSIVKLEEIVPIPNQAHTEDVLYSMMKVIGRVNASNEVLQQFVDTVHEVIFYGTDRAIDIPTYEAGDHSLMFVRADEAEIVADVGEEKTRYRMLLVFNGIVYDLSVTDPYFIDALNEKRIKIGLQPDLYVTLSLGLVYEERHHKLIAAVVFPSSEVDQSKTNKVLAVKQETHVVSICPLTKKERRTIKKAFVVPSRNGYAVCFRRRNGGEDFMTIDKGCNVKAWQRIAPRILCVVTYSNEKKMIRLKERSHIVEFFRKRSN